MFASYTEVKSVFPMLAHGDRCDVPRLTPLQLEHLTARNTKNFPARAFSRQLRPSLSVSGANSEGFWFDKNSVSREFNIIMCRHDAQTHWPIACP